MPAGSGGCYARGDADLEVEEWLWVLQKQAAASGGAVYHLLGNHEVNMDMYNPARKRLKYKPRFIFCCCAKGIQVFLQTSSHFNYFVLRLFTVSAPRWFSRCSCKSLASNPGRYGSYSDDGKNSE